MTDLVYNLVEGFKSAYNSVKKSITARTACLVGAGALALATPIYANTNAPALPSSKASAFRCTPGVAYAFGEGALLSGASVDCGSFSVTPSVIVGEETGASLALGKEIGKDLEAEVSGAALGDRSTFALGLEKFFATSNNRTKLGLGGGAEYLSGTEKEGTAGYGKISLTRKTGRNWQVGVNLLVDTSGNLALTAGFGYNPGSNAGGYRPGIAGMIIPNTKAHVKSSDDSNVIPTTSSNDSRSGEQTSENDENDDDPVIPPTPTPTGPQGGDIGGGPRGH